MDKGQTIQWTTEKKKKEQATIYKTLHRELKIELTGGEFECSGRVSNSCSTRGTFLVTWWSYVVICI
jgi:hypothetical protein